MVNCAGCGSSVYPTEELRCLDQIWHKRCFRCSVCQKILGIHNCKGYKGQPYCSVHYPTFNSFTFVKDTPELQQILANTKNMSRVEYHKDYENARGMKISVADDPVTRNQKNVSKLISNTRYAQPIAASPASSTPVNASSGTWFSQSIVYPSAETSNSNFSKGNLTSNRDSNSNPLGYTVKGSNGADLRYNQEKKISKASEVSKKSDASVAEMARNDGELIEIAPKLILLGGLRVTGSGMAVYDYDANDSDEVSFKEGDEILHGEAIDDGWMYGTVKRTGQFGMLPSNYVIPVQGSNLHP